MKLWLLVPVKPFAEGKSRLAESLSPDQRAELSQNLLGRVLSVARDSTLFAGMLVISRDRTVLAEAVKAGAEAVAESEDGLNSALDAARSQAVVRGADAILVLPSDLPLLEVSDLELLYELPDGKSTVVIAPSRDGGTNALLLHPPHAIDFAFGVDSFRRHRRLAELADVSTRIVHSPTLALDIDRPIDLQRLAAIE